MQGQLLADELLLMGMTQLLWGKLLRWKGTWKGCSLGDPFLGSLIDTGESFPFLPHWREGEAIFTIAANIYLQLLPDLGACVSPFCENVPVPSKPVL